MNSCKDLSQIFYNHNKFDNPTDLLSLEPYFFSALKHTENMEYKEPNIVDLKDDISPPHEPTQSLTIKWFAPLQKDTIFWCVFAFIYGHTEYLMVGSRYGNRELEEKSKMISYFNESKKQLKQVNHKITNINIQEIVSEFLSLQNETTFLGIIGLVAFYKIRILLVDECKKIYIDFHTLDDTASAKTCILYKNTTLKGKYRMNPDTNEADILHIQTNMLRLEHFTKPLRAISSYKLGELEEIAKSVGLCTHDSNLHKYKKPELYMYITEYCNWNR